MPKRFFHPMGVDPQDSPRQEGKFKLEITMGMDLSIIIVNYYLEKYLTNCLSSIHSTIHQFSYETFLVDNGSQEGAKEIIRKEFPMVHIISNKMNAGFARANNQAMKESRGDYTLLLNPDTLVEKGAIETMIFFLKNHSEAGVAGPKLLNPDGSLQFSCRAFPGFWTPLFNRYSLLTRLFPNNPFSRYYLLSDWDHDSIQEVDWVSGACLMTRREVINEVGLMDEGYFMFNEDVDWCKRIKDQGWRIYYLPQAQVIHYIGSSKGRVSPRLIIERHKGMQHYFHKHYNIPWALRLVVDLLIMGRGLVLLLVNFLKNLLANPKG